MIRSMPITAANSAPALLRAHWYYLNGDATQMATYLTSCTATSGECWQGANTYLTISNHGAHPGDTAFPSTMRAIRRWVSVRSVPVVG